MEQTEYGLTAANDGWFVVNVREAAWMTNEYFGEACVFEGDAVAFPDVGYTTVSSAQSWRSATERALSPRPGHPTARTCRSPNGSPGRRPASTASRSVRDTSTDGHRRGF